MRSRRLGCFTSTGIITTIITLISITGFAFASGGAMFSPGKLNADQGPVLGGVSSHAEIAGDCELCHTAPWQAATMDDRCIACHATISAELGDLSSIHGRLYDLDPKAQCRDCHPEHNGLHAMLTVIEAWRFPHQITGYSLNGHQAKAENEAFLCLDCHGEDVTTFNPNVCSDCHSQANNTFMLDHHLAFGETCLNCHDGVDTFGDDFSHNKFAFALTGSHALAFCSQCHLGSTKIADLKVVPQTCLACHEKDDPHAGSLGTECAKCHTPEAWKAVQYDHNLASFKLVGMHVDVTCKECHSDHIFTETPTECVACHQQDDFHDGRFGMECVTCHNPSSWKDWTFNHSLAAFQLTGKHENVACENCHTSGYGGTPKDCVACHQKDDRHKGQFGPNCAECHNTGGWADVNFDHGQFTGFTLNGQHAGVTCEACHINGIYKGTPTNCYGCHAAKDAHKGQFGTDCATCHNSSGWKNVTFDHNSTAFKLNGKHQNVACTTCHTNGTFKGTPQNCYACHAAKDAHKGQFGTDCGACHSTSGWGGANFNHANTGFPLNGRHSNAQCSSCHANGVYKGTPKNCYACHASKDAHNGRFGTDCGACHSTNGWGGASFDHNITSFPLVGKHRKVSCDSCHKNGVYQGLSTSCVTCHRDEHDGRNGTDCERCHTPNGWGD